MLIKMRKMLKKGEDQKGFTLVELIIVMAILAILAAIAVPRFGATLSKAKTQADEANQAMISKAVELAYVNGDLDLGTATKTAPKTIDLQTDLVDKGYLDKVPNNPTGGAAYTVTAYLEASGTEKLFSRVIVTITP